MLERAVRASLARQGRAALRAQGRSMHPAIADGALLNLAPLGDGEVAPGEVVAFMHGAEVYAHRVQLVEGAWLLTAGDGNLLLDLPVRRSAVLGRVIDAVPPVQRSGPRVPTPVPDTLRVFVDAELPLRAPSGAVVLHDLAALNAVLEQPTLLVHPRGVLSREEGLARVAGGVRQVLLTARVGFSDAYVAGARAYGVARPGPLSLTDAGWSAATLHAFLRAAQRAVGEGAHD